MDVVRLVTQAKTGDVDAFTELVRGYQAMAFGYAYSNLHDFHLAEDAVQQAFVVAYNNLERIEQPERFGGWLRAIVRFECLHLLRSHRVVPLPIDAVSELAATSPGPAEITEERDGVDRILVAIDTLPPAEREATILFYIHDHSQRDVAEFLNLPVTTVNNRLRSARKRLREERLIAMTKDAFREHGLPETFAANIGEIVRFQRPVVDVRFTPDHQPSVLSSLTVTDNASKQALTADVVQHLDDHVVRCIVTGPDQNVALLDRGMRIIDNAAPISTSLDPALMKQMIASMRCSTGESGLLETGIKAIDVLAPLPAGSLVGLIGDAQTGKMVLVEELIHRLGDAPEAISILVFVEAPTEVTVIRNLEYRTSAAVEAIYLPVTDASAEALKPITGELDAVITLSRSMAEHQLYPAIDPLESTSRMLSPEIVGKEHYDVATGVRRFLEQTAKRPSDDRSRDDTVMEHRAAQIQRFLTQPFFVAEAFTNQPGQVVPRTAAVQGCKALLEGRHDDLTEDVFYMAGTLNDALARP